MVDPEVVRCQAILIGLLNIDGIVQFTRKVRLSMSSTEQILKKCTIPRWVLLSVALCYKADENADESKSEL
jgi:hypothetical protein